MDHVQKFSQIKVRWIIPLFPLGTITARLIRTMFVSILNLTEVNPITSIIFRVYTSAFWFLVILVILAKLKLSPRKFIGAFPQPRMWLLALISVPLYIAAIFLLPFYREMLQHFLPAFAEYLDSLQFVSAVYNLTNPAHTVIVNSIMALFLIIIIPIYEEALFKGIILRRWAYKFGEANSIFLTSLLFGLLHYHNFLHSFVFSYVLSKLYVKTKGLYIPILSHMLYNGIVFLLIIV